MEQRGIDFQIYFMPQGIRLARKGLNLEVRYPWADLPFFSQLILGGKETSLEPVQELLVAYQIPVIRERIAVVNKDLNWLSLKSFADLKLIFAEKPEDVLLTSIKDGLRTLSINSQRIILFLANRPLLEKERLERMMKESLKVEKIIVPLISGHRSHPIIIPRCLVPSILKTRKETGLPYLEKRFRLEYQL